MSVHQLNCLLKGLDRFALSARQQQSAAEKVERLRVARIGRLCVQLALELLRRDSWRAVHVAPSSFKARLRTLSGRTRDRKRGCVFVEDSARALIAHAAVEGERGRA